MIELAKKALRIIKKKISKLSSSKEIPDLGFKTKNTDQRIAIIGLGKQGSKLCRYLNQMDYNVVAVCDISRRKARKIKKEFPKVNIVKNIESLSEFRIDICVIATLAVGRLSIIKRLNNIGIDKILVEKPVTNNMADNSLLKKYVEHKNIRIEVYHPFLFSKDIQNFKEEIRKLEKGEFLQAKILFKPAGLGNIGSHAITSFLYLSDINIDEVISSAMHSHPREKRRGKSFSDPNAKVVFSTKRGKKIFLDNTDLACSMTKIFIEYENLFINLYNNEKLVVQFKNIKNNDKMFLSKNSINKHYGRYLAIDQALSSLSNFKSHSFHLSIKAVELIIACHVSHKNSQMVRLPLNEDTEIIYNFS
tara:strand:+ start:8904 stop:9989 length:1086 start_codon:yes stop_codon:yes gene_type:complete